MIRAKEQIERSTATPAKVWDVRSDGKGGFDVTASHAYAAAQSFPVTIDIHSVGGSAQTAMSTALVSPGGTTATITSLSVDLIGDQILFRQPAGVSMMTFSAPLAGSTVGSRATKRLPERSLS